jgi:hypothetical protein
MRIPTQIFTVSCLFALTSTVADAQASTTIEKQKFSGSQATAGFVVGQSITCADGTSGTVSAFAFVSGADQITTVTGQPKTSSNGVFVELDSYSNSCTGTNIGFGDGGISGGFTAPDQKLTSATLAGTALVQNFDNGQQIAVSLNLVLNGIGPVSSGHTVSTNRTGTGSTGPFSISVSHSANANRAATPTGTVTIEGFSLTPSFFSGEILTNDNASIMIQR